jgi:hypothetical protein
MVVRKSTDNRVTAHNVSSMFGVMSPYHPEYKPRETPKTQKKKAEADPASGRQGVFFLT